MYYLFPPAKASSGMSPPQISAEACSECHNTQNLMTFWAVLRFTVNLNWTLLITSCILRIVPTQEYIIFSRVHSQRQPFSGRDHDMLMLKRFDFYSWNAENEVNLPFLGPTFIENSDSEVPAYVLMWLVTHRKNPIIVSGDCKGRFMHYSIVQWQFSVIFVELNEEQMLKMWPMIYKWIQLKNIRMIPRVIVVDCLII